MVHRAGGVAPLLVSLGCDRGDYLLEARVRVDEGEAAENVSHVQQVVPHEGIFELAEGAANAEQVVLLPARIGSMLQEHLCSGMDGGYVMQLRDERECLQCIHTGDRAGC